MVNSIYTFTWLVAQINSKGSKIGETVLQLEKPTQDWRERSLVADKDFPLISDFRQAEKVCQDPNATELHQISS